MITNTSEGSISQSGATQSSAMHQLVVLTVVSGGNFPAPAPGDVTNIIVRGLLSGCFLVTEPVLLKSSNPDLNEQQLVWEVTPAQLREFRSRKILLRVEVFLNTVSF